MELTINDVKGNIGDEVYVVQDGHIRKLRIRSIYYNLNKKK